MKNQDRRQEPEDRRAEPKGPGSNVADATLRHIADALRGIQYGSVVVIVQDGVVVQIERTEKTRINRPSN